MRLIISNNRDKPIYEQIIDQVKGMIMSNELLSGQKIPSIRVLAKQLKVSITTVQKAYEELQREGFIETEIGRGTYISEPNKELLRDENLKLIEGQLEKAVELAKRNGVSYEEVAKILKIIYVEDV